MKKLSILLLSMLLCVTLLSCKDVLNDGSGARPDGTSGSGEQNPHIPASSGLAVGHSTTDEVKIKGILLHQFADDSFLVAQMGEETANQEIFIIGFENAKVLSGELKTNQIVEIAYDGAILETYPAQLSGVESVQILDEESDHLFRLFQEIVDLMYEKDPALNDQITEISVDFPEPKLLSRSQENALLYLLQLETGKEILRMDYGVLLDSGRITQDPPYYENGVFISVSAEQSDNGTVTFSAQKWRSGLGAIFTGDTEAVYQDGSWQYEITEWMAA